MKYKKTFRSVHSVHKKHLSTTAMSVADWGLYGPDQRVDLDQAPFELDQNPRKSFVDATCSEKALSLRPCRSARPGQAPTLLEQVV